MTRQSHTVSLLGMRMLRKIVLWAAIFVAAVVLAFLAATIALWMSVAGTFFRGEQVNLGTLFQIGVATLSCVGLGFLIRWMARAAAKA